MVSFHCIVKVWEGLQDAPCVEVVIEGDVALLEGALADLLHLKYPAYPRHSTIVYVYNWLRLDEDVGYYLFRAIDSFPGTVLARVVLVVLAVAVHSPFVVVVYGK